MSTAQTFGLTSLHVAHPERFDELVQRYGELLDLVLEQRAYKVDHRISQSLRSMAEQLGLLRAGPRDLIEIHTTILKTKSAAAPPQEVQAYAEEGRITLLELMGYLVSYYGTLPA